MDNILDKKGIEQHSHLLQPWKKEAFAAFAYKMTDIHHPFPCIPATKGFHFNHLRYSFIDNNDEDQSIYELANLLKSYGAFSRKYGAYTSLIVFINLSSAHTVEEYEQLFWKTLSRVRELDDIPLHSYMTENPHHPAWEFSYNREPYFVYCATPEHKRRISRSFPYMLLAFTPRWVLQHFHDTHSNVEKMKSLIRKRLTTYDEAPVHPELKWYGQQDNYEWKQYFLRDDETSPSACPFANFHKKKNQS